MTNEQITKVEAVEHGSNHKFAFSRYANLRDFEVYKFLCYFWSEKFLIYFSHYLPAIISNAQKIKMEVRDNGIKG